MLIHVDCFKLTGKRLSGHAVAVPDEAKIRLRNHVQENPSLWPVASIDRLITVVTPANGSVQPAEVIVPDCLEEKTDGRTD